MKNVSSINFGVIVLILTSFLNIGFAQTGASKAILALSTEEKNCDNLQQAIDYLSSHLQNDLSASLYIILYGKEPDKVGKIIERAIEFRKFNKDRIFIVLGTADGMPKTEFWLVPVGANPPESAGKWIPKEKEFDLTLTKPAFFGAEYESPEGSCFPPPSPFPRYAEYLKQTPALRGRIVLVVAGAALFREGRKTIRKRLLDEYGIKPERVEIIHKSLKKSQFWEAAIEYWFLPVLKKKNK